MRKIIVGLLLVALGYLPAANAGKPPGAGGGGTGGGGTGTEGVVGQNLGVLPGDNYSDAWDVNAQGHAVGRSYSSGSKTTPQLTKAFYWAGGACIGSCQPPMAMRLRRMQSAARRPTQKRRLVSKAKGFALPLLRRRTPST